MAKTRLLKGVAHDLADSFTSATNYISGNYMEYIMAVSLRDQVKDIKFDLFNETVSPGCYRSEDTKICIEKYKRWFFSRIEKLGFSPDDFHSLTLHIAIRDIENVGSENNHKLQEVSVTVNILMAEGKEISYTIIDTWQYPDDMSHYKKIIENMDYQGSWGKLSSPELILIKSLSDEIFGRRKLIQISEYFKSQFAVLGKRKNVRLIVSLTSTESLYETYKWLEFVSRRLFNASGYDPIWGSYFKPMLNVRVFRAKCFGKIEYDILEEEGLHFIRVRLDLQNKKQYVEIEQKLIEKQEITEARITYDYKNITPYTVNLVRKDAEFLNKLFHQVFHFERVDIQLSEQ
ncbi:hypothetical protein ACSAZK_01145 [Methanosarcina sp. Mfa9]|uniref:hypothetical protein n=1 Tax=Methanosarcina sp. Mfa9 TaxID=3439063 RepID=UPI003F856FF9